MALGNSSGDISDLGAWALDLENVRRQVAEPPKYLTMRCAPARLPRALRTFFDYNIFFGFNFCCTVAVFNTSNALATE
ncbi:uncharacterized protein BO88DRAFT_489436 [Aspergillus vadensis CBS 113365]|uniref:Uncharacterized protein n=1 Tax=Aspergillus vadensis (strain CBS 113365 / IMI 142717 / IBT 24658) TaxID=1448311 RepID=A0A319B5M0_ASPVC|nr:hypothetical protein BO88DRAFT_489436 [Aspergillus vadensis CBS 113365]PYH67104.1 hypothetical protein BO88DRAFT_489436 [Aspergillus vadensis CBS 113365]